MASILKIGISCGANGDNLVGFPKLGHMLFIVSSALEIHYSVAPLSSGTMYTDPPMIINHMNNAYTDHDAITYV